MSGGIAGHEPRKSATDVYHIGAITWTEEGCVVAYTTEDDIRVGGHLMSQRTLHMHRGHPDYREDMDKVHDRIVRMVKNAEEDFADSPPWRGDDEVPDEDDEKGMGE